MRPSDRPWTDDDVWALIRMRHGGESFDAIAEALGRTENAVRCYAECQVGIVSRKVFERMKRELRPDATNGPRPKVTDFLSAGWNGEDNRGWGRFLEDGPE